jgi:nucleoside-diphosphate-sugar epimerase
LRILITGGAGYIGSILTETALDGGHEVVVLDRFFFGRTLDHLADRPGLSTIKGDIRWVDEEIVQGIDAVFDLSAISNDPAGELDPAATLAINFEGRARIARLAKQNGVGRYVLASSCSIYGFQDGLLDERSPVNPLTTYAKANLEAENANLPLADDEYCVTVLRQATVYGLSARMRFDLAINGMTLGVATNGSIPVLRDGTQWRPMVHVRDTSRAFLAVAEADPALVNGEIFNVGSNEQNFQILPLARRVSEAVGVPFRHEWYGDPDHRSYQVSFDKIRETLSFEAQYTPEDAARDIYEALEKGVVEPSPKTRTVEWYRTLIEWRELLDDVLLDGTLL